MTYIPNPHPALAELTPNGQAKVDFLAWFNDGYVIDDHHLLAGRPDMITIKLLPEARQQNVIHPGLIIKHTQGGSKKSTNANLWTYCNNQTVVDEPHVAGPQMDDGKMLQMMPFNITAHCSKDANYFLRDGKPCGAISFETQDLGSDNADINKTPWTLQQLNSSAGALTACCATYGIRCTAPAWYRDNGIGHHNLFVEWSKRIPNACPGNARIRQMDWLRQEVAGRLGNYYNAVGMVCP